MEILIILTAIGVIAALYFFVKAFSSFNKMGEVVDKNCTLTVRTEYSQLATKFVFYLLLALAIAGILLVASLLFL